PHARLHREGLRGPQTGAAGVGVTRGPAPGSRQARAGALQVSARHRVPPEAAAHRDREDPALHPPSVRRRSLRPEGSGVTEPRIKHSIPDARWPTQAEAAASLWFSPTHIGRLAVEQRTWVPAMVPWRATEDGFVTAEVLDWYARFAEGRPGVLVVEATGIRDIASGPLLRIGDDRFIPGLRRLVETVRERSEGHTRLFIQILDFLTVRRRPEPATLFAEAARRARDAGFDGVELHYAHAYTMASFLSRLNDRADGYGGSREQRVRVPLEALAAVRRSVGDEYVVGIRFLGDDVVAGG